jgi:ADP-ribose pyrophosphatase
LERGFEVRLSILKQPKLTMPIGTELPQLLKQRLFYKGRKFDFEVNRLRLPNQAEGDWECIRHPGGALAVPVTPDGKLVLVRQYRFAVGGRILEFPAGTVEINEDPLDTVKREIEEETGYHANKWQKLGEFFLAPGYSDEVIYAFLATELEKLEKPPAQDEDEDIETLLWTPEQLEKAIYEGEPVDAKSISSFLLARKFLS